MLNQTTLASLHAVVDKKRVITDPGEMLVYENDATQSHGKPDAVIFPKSVDELAKLVRWASEHNVPIVARGAGTGLSGGAVAERGGIIVEFSNFDHVLEFDTLGRSVVVEPGIVNLALDTYVKTKGLYYPPDPASGRSATLGGNIAENSGGPHCFKYGVTANYITGLEVILADGRVVHTGGRALDYPEYDLNGLLVGSEGTLGLFTKMSARLMRNPPGVKTMMAAFDSVEIAGKAVSAVIAAGVIPATMEMMDQMLIRVVEDFVHIGLPVDAAALLIIEVDGFGASLDAQMSEVSRLLDQNGGHDLKIAKTAEERDKIWYGRKSAIGGMAKLAPSYMMVDGTVPRSRLADTLDAVGKICAEKNLRVGYVFHAGDGNLHPLIPIHPSDATEVANATQACEDIMRAVVERDGTITGEHGIGTEKREFMLFQFDGAEISAMWDVKQVFDSKNILNPAKIFPAQMPAVNKVAPATSLPSDVFAPKNSQDAAASLAALSNAKRRVYINAKHDGAVTLSTRELCGIIKYSPDDLYVTVGAGTPLDEVQAFLAKEGRQVPLASPWRETTIGGIVATNLNSPQRIRYGAVRDQLLCATVALADGRVIRAGRAVVKNVAGYDLPKVFVGSYGTLGLLTDVTFKMTPLPRAKKSLVVPVNDLKQGLAWGMQLLQVALMASAVAIYKGNADIGVTSQYALVYTAEGYPQDVETELAQVRQVLQNANAPIVESESVSGVALWCDLLGTATQDSIQVRAGVAAKDIANFVGANSSTLDRGTWLADVASGLVYAVASANDAQSSLDALRKSALALGGYAMATHVPSALENVIDRWGYPSETLDLMRALKSKWDPAGILGAGVFIPNA